MRSKSKKGNRGMQGKENKGSVIFGWGCGKSYEENKPIGGLWAFWKKAGNRKCEASEELLYYEGRTKKSGFGIGCGVAGEARWKDYVTGTEEEGMAEPVECRVETGGCYAKAEREFSAKAGKELIFDTYIVYFSSQDVDGPLYDAAVQECRRCREIGYDRLKAEQKEAFRTFWKYGDVKIKGDDRLCQGIRFNLFHIMQAAGRDGKPEWGQKGYRGKDMRDIIFGIQRCISCRYLSIPLPQSPRLCWNTVIPRWNRPGHGREC